MCVCISQCFYCYCLASKIIHAADKHITAATLLSEFSKGDKCSGPQEAHIEEIATNFKRATYELFVVKCDSSKSTVELKLAVREMFTDVIDLGCKGSLLLKNFKRACEKSLKSMEAAYRYLNDCLESEAIEKINVTEEIANSMHDSTQLFLNEIIKCTEKLQDTKKLIVTECEALKKENNLKAAEENVQMKCNNELEKERDALRLSKEKQKGALEDLNLKKKEIAQSIQKLEDEITAILREESVAFQQRRYRANLRDAEDLHERNCLQIAAENKQFQHKIEEEAKKLTEKGKIYVECRIQNLHDRSQYNSEIDKLNQEFETLISTKKGHSESEIQRYEAEYEKEIKSLNLKKQRESDKSKSDFETKEKQQKIKHENQLSHFEAVRMSELDKIDKEMQMEQLNVFAILSFPIRLLKSWVCKSSVDNSNVQTFNRDTHIDVQLKKDNTNREAEQKIVLQELSNQEELQKIYDKAAQETQEIDKKYHDLTLAAEKTMNDLINDERIKYVKEMQKLTEEKDSCIREAKKKWDSARVFTESIRDAKLQKELKVKSDHYSQQNHSYISASLQCESDLQTDSIFEESRVHLKSIETQKQELCEQEDELNKQIKEYSHQLSSLEKKLWELDFRFCQMQGKSFTVTSTNFTEVTLLCTDRCIQVLTKNRDLVGNIGLFWIEVKAFCGDNIKKIQLQIKHVQNMSEQSRQGMWSSQTFQNNAIVFYNRWGKIKKMCEIVDKELKVVLNTASQWNSDEISKDDSDTVLKNYKDKGNPY